MPEHTLKVPPFPPLTWDEYFWVGTAVLSSWAGFQRRRGAYNCVSSAASSGAEVTITVAGPGDEARRPPPAAEQAAAWQILNKNEAIVAAAVLEAVFAVYPGLRDAYDYDVADGEGAERMPAIIDPSSLRRLIGLGQVHVLPVAKDGVAYVGFESGSTWDDEHGLGVMTHKGRVLEIGQADTSFNDWIARQDGGEEIRTGL